MQKRVVLEILVDKNNEKWAIAFEQVLLVVHKLLESKKKTFFKTTTPDRPDFSFEIAKVGNKIRFFLVVPEAYKNFIKNQIYAHYSNVEINELEKDYMQMIPDKLITIWQVSEKKHYLYPLKTYNEFESSGQWWVMDPFSSITSGLNKISINWVNIFQVNFSPIWDDDWKSSAKKIIPIISGNLPNFAKNFLLSPKYKYYKPFLWPFSFIWTIFSSFFKKHEDSKSDSDDSKKDDKLSENPDLPRYFAEKLSTPGYSASINIICASENVLQSKFDIKEIASTLAVYDAKNTFKISNVSRDAEFIKEVKQRVAKNDFILNTLELSALVHLPTNYVKTPSINWVSSRLFEPPSNLPLLKTGNNLTPIWKSNFRWSNLDFWVGPNDRRRHMYILWKTWMGKSTLLENMIVDDINKWRWVAVIDPHGDLAENILGLIPKERTNSVIIFDPSDVNFPIAFNMLEDVKEEHRSLVASGIVSIFKKMFDSWGPRLEHILRNTILALLEYPNSTLMSIPLMLTSEVYRKKVVEKIKDPIVKKFWTGEFDKMAPNQKVEAAGPILNKVGQFLSSTILRNILGQTKNTFSLRWAMDNQKIVIINLSKWKIWEDASSLLGSMMVTKFQMEAMSRADIPEKDRVDFYLYVDEFQNFATDSFATILSEARKYKLNLVMANQYIDQMTENVRWAVFGNVWSIASFQVGYHDASILKEVLWADVVSTDDLTNLRKYSIYTKLLIDGMPSKVFSADTYSPYKTDPEVFKTRYDKILKVSREKYAKPREFVVSKINQMMEEIDKREEVEAKRLKDFKDKKEKEKQNKMESMMKDKN